jgi:hypothetical protein
VEDQIATISEPGFSLLITAFNGMANRAGGHIMLRRVGLVLILALAGTGCLFPGAKPSGQVVGKNAKIDEASLELAERVEDVAQKLLHGTPLGLPEMDVLMVGLPDPELFHRDSHVLYISEGLVKQCKDDETLAAMLARDIATMTVEFRRTLARAGTDFTTKQPDFMEADALAGTLLRNAGYEQHTLKATKEMHNSTLGHSALAKQLGGAKATPKWSK